MSSRTMKTQDSDEEVDLEALRLAALKSRKPKYPCVNHNNLIPIVPMTVETKDFVNTKIKLERVSPTRDDKEGVKANKEAEEEKASNCSKITLENDQDILSMDDKEEEDSLERLMDQLEAEISGKAPISTDRSASSNNKKENRTSKKNDKDGDDEIELVQIKTGKEPSAIIEIRESASPELGPKGTNSRKSTSPKASRDSGWRSRSKLRSRSPFLRERSYRRSRSPYWSRSPRRSRSPFRRSRSPYWLSRKSRSKSRSPFMRRYRSPPRKRSPFSRFSRSRSTSYGRRSPWSMSPRRRSKSPFYHDDLPPRRAFNSPRRSFSPRRTSKSPRPLPRSPFYRRSKSPYRRSRSPYRRASLRRSESPFLRRSKSPLSKLHSPNRSPIGKKFSKSPPRRSSPKLIEKLSPKHRSKSPGRRYDGFIRSPGRSKEGRSLSISTSPIPRRNRSPLKVVEKNRPEGTEKNDKLRDRNRSERRHKSLSRENNRTHDRRTNRPKYFRRSSPSRSRRSPDRQHRRSKSPKRKDASEKSKEEISKPKEKEPSPTPAAPLDPVLEARKKKFETLGEVDPTVDKKINLKSIKESTENPEDDEDILTLNLDTNLWDESEESEDEFESRFKSDGARKNRVGANNRTVLSFRNLREGGTANPKANLSKPLIDDSRRDKYKRDRSESWVHGRGGDRRKPRSDEFNERNDEKDSTRSKPSDKSISSSARPEKKSGRRPIVWSSKNEQKLQTVAKDGEEPAKESEVKENRNKFSERVFGESKDKLRRSDSDMHEADDFDKLISDFEKELENDLCLTTKEVSSTVATTKSEVKRPKISIKKDFEESKVEPPVKKPLPRIVKISEASLNKFDKSLESANATKLLEEDRKIELNEPQRINEGPEDYIEDDDFVLETPAARKQRNKGEEEDSQSDLRAVLSRRRNERLTKAVSLQENMPTRLVQSAFQGLGNKKSNRQMREVQESKEFPLSDKTAGGEGRRVLLLHREKNPVPSIKCTVPEVKPDTTIHQRFTRSSARRKRKLHRQLEPVEGLDQEEEEQDGLEVEEEKQFRRFRLKRNVTLSSQNASGARGRGSDLETGSRLPDSWTTADGYPFLLNGLPEGSTVQLINTPACPSARFHFSIRPGKFITSTRFARTLFLTESVAPIKSKKWSIKAK